jgi:hypothetical protein
VDVVLRDEFNAGDFSKLFANRAISVSYATTTLSNKNYCISFEGAL